MKHYISYLRISTQKQGHSGLGLEAQRKAVGLYVKDPELILKEYIEVESGKDNLRVELHKAIAHAKATGATLLIAKLDRLSRNVAFIFTLKEAGVEFVCADMPEANTLTIGIFAVLAQHERELISSRTKAALQEKATQLARVGAKLGTPANLTVEARKKGVEVLKAKARVAKENVQALELIYLYRAVKNSRGKPLTFQAIADRLNSKGFKTGRGKDYSASWVRQLLCRETIDGGQTPK